MWRDISRATIRGRLRDLLDEIEVEERVPIRLYLPNLRCREIHISGGLNARPLRIAVTVENAGQARSKECYVHAQVWLSVANQTHLLAARCPALDAGTAARVELGAIPGVAENQFANVTVIIDPPTAALPGGEVWEPNEQDNGCFDGVYLAPAPVPEIPEEFPDPPGEPQPPDPPIRR
jgi:hypothetical protein